MKKLILLLTLTFSFLPALAADKGKGKAGTNQVVAKLQTGKQKWVLSPDGFGNFPVVITVTNKSIEIELTYPGGQEGQLAVATIRDAGTLTGKDNQGKGKGNDSAPVSILRDRLDKQGRLRFTFHYGINHHAQHVTVKVGQQVHAFEFHVGF